MNLAPDPTNSIIRNTALDNRAMYRAIDIIKSEAAQ